MMLNKSLVSFIAAFAIASGVTASTTPVARSGGGSSCNSGTGTEACCNTITNANNPIVAILKPLVDIFVPTDASIPLGISCVDLVTGGTCTAQSVCCQNVSSNGFINVNCVAINL